MDAPQAGRKLASLAKEYDFSLFEYWASDYAGHHQEMDTAVGLMETFDGVLGGLLEEMSDELLVFLHPITAIWRMYPRAGIRMRMSLRW